MMGVFKNKTVFCLPPVEKLACDQAFRTELLKKKRYKVWIGFAGRIAREKGIEYLITALKGIKNCELVFAGPYGADVAGENPYYQRILAQLQQSNTPYIFFGNLRGCQLGTFYKTVDMLVLPSINQTEAFGMVQAECMMTGTPVIASDLPGVRVPIQMTKMGMLVESKNSIELRRAIKHIIANRSTYSNEALRKHAESLFDIRKVLHFYDKLFV
jgi:glycosyltransferase involved in cell wall biosynthesis